MRRPEQSCEFLAARIKQRLQQCLPFGQGAEHVDRVLIASDLEEDRQLDPFPLRAG